MHMEVRSNLTSNHAVVLNQVKAIGVVCTHKCFGGPADSMNYGHCLFIGEIEKSRGMRSWNYVDLPKLKLSPVHECEGHLSLFDDAFI